VVITASRGLEYSFEGSDLIDAHDVPPSVFTSALVRGLKSGEADQDQDGQVGVDELYDYIFAEVQKVTPHQTPGMWIFELEGELHIARRSSPVSESDRMRADLRQAINSSLPKVRITAIQELAGLLRGSDPGMAVDARDALEWLAQDDNRDVAAAAATVLRPSSAPSDQPGLLPSVDRRPTARMPLPTKALRIGRIPDNDLVLSDLNVSRHHAELRKSPTGSYEIVDLGSHNGTFVNGQKVSSQSLTEDDLVSIGYSTFRLMDGELRQFVDESEVIFSVKDLGVRARGKVLLDQVTFSVPDLCVVGVIGPESASKSALLNALTGIRPADTGTVRYDDRNLYQHYEELRTRIGVVPRESILPTRLDLRPALQKFAAARLPASPKVDQEARVEEVMAELDLTNFVGTRVNQLCGSQLKRANIALELLTMPSLLFLDEPTVGLDANLGRVLMEQIKELAHDSRAIVVFTPSLADLDICFRLLVLAPGGRTAFYGPADEGLRYFGRQGWTEVLRKFEQEPTRDWAAEFAASPDYARWLLGPEAGATARRSDANLPTQHHLLQPGRGRHRRL
jgi:ABC-type multidrug transport system ATPase subunit